MISELVDATLERIKPLGDPSLSSLVEDHWDSLTKPRGSLGKLERLYLHYALIANRPDPLVEAKGLFIFCGDHGVVDEGVSAYPQEVTRQMVHNFLAGGAAICVLCRHFGIEPVVVDMGVKGDEIPGTVNLKVAPGTVNFVRAPAMSRRQAIEAIEAGIELAIEASGRFHVVGIGEMGIGNTTSAAALFSAFSGRDAIHTVGAGTGVDEAGLARKRLAVQEALLLHRDATDPIAILAAYGGFEIAAMAGFLLGAAAERLPVVVDGFISSSAALVARALAPDSLDVALFSHRSAERAHALMLDFLGVEPQFDLDLRLGEGTGAALAINLLETAWRLYTEMASFSSAGVTDSGAGQDTITK
jgi:nicotinate-nucleotide--dimethylbenzimidazole phosphoribosyltransferase